MEKNHLFNAVCILSIIGIWPRYIEPNLLATTHVPIKIPNLPHHLNHFKILQISDLHLNPYTSDLFLKKILRKTSALKPDLILHTGDLLCRSKIPQKSRLQTFLSQFQAPYGCFTVLGNHDYAEYISVNTQGDYAPFQHGPSKTHRLLNKTPLTGKFTKESDPPKLNTELLDLISKTPFQLLHNHTTQISVGETFLNVCGLGDYMAGHFKPNEAFSCYDSNYPGIILSHNPDSTPKLQNYPGDLILSGHTHGAQVNLPWIWNRLTLIENIEYKRGLNRKENKWIYTNRGVGAVSPVRLFSLPEITLFTLESET